VSRFLWPTVYVICQTSSTVCSKCSPFGSRSFSVTGPTVLSVDLRDCSCWLWSLRVTRQHIYSMDITQHQRVRSVCVIALSKSTFTYIHTYEICNALIIEDGSNQRRGLLLGGGV